MADRLVQHDAGPAAGEHDVEGAAQGTLLDSIDSAIRAWSKWAARHGVDFEQMRHRMHGMRAIETIRRWGPADLDVEAEAEALTEAMETGLDDSESKLRAFIDFLVQAFGGGADFVMLGGMLGFFRRRGWL